MPSNLTQMSAAEYDKILYGNMTPSMAAAYLQERDIPLRNFPQVLQSMSPGADLLPRLVEYLSRIGPGGRRGFCPVPGEKKRTTGFLGATSPPTGRDYFRIALCPGAGGISAEHLAGAVH